VALRQRVRGTKASLKRLRPSLDNSKKVFSVVVALILMIDFTGCGTSTKRPVSGTGVEAPIEQAESLLQGASAKEVNEFKNVQAAYQGGQFDQVQSRAMLFEKHFPKSSLRAQNYNLRGLGYLGVRQPLKAAAAFKKAIELDTKNTLGSYVLYNLATAQYQLGQIDDAQTQLQKILLENLDKWNRVKIHYLKSKIYIKKNLPMEAARECFSAGRLFNLVKTSESNEAQTAFTVILDQSLARIRKMPVYEALFKEYEDSIFADRLLFQMGSEEIALGNPGAGEVHLKNLINRFPNSAYYAQALDLIKSAQTASVVDSGAIGVLLPLKGKFATYGQSDLESIELAFRFFDSESANPNVRLIIEDSGDEPSQAIKALDKLVFKHHVIAIIGPLASKGIEQVTQRANSLGVPLLSLARYPGSQGNYIFQSGVTLGHQSREVARYAVEKLKLRRFAILHPRDKVGEAASQYFWDAVESLGGEVVGIESYIPNETDFRQVVDKLSGLYYQDARQTELDALAKERELQNIKRKTRKTEKFFNLKPIIDYDAVFVPDEPKVAGQLLPTFSYRDVDKITFLGTSAWNSDEFVKRIPTSLPNIYFVDAFYPQSTSQNVQNFISLFKSVYDREPTGMDAMAYDTAVLVDSIMKRLPSDAKRSDFRDILSNVKNFPGISGTLSFGDPNNTRGLKVFTLSSSKIMEVQ
jgi:branched-chain amino acid transport system substrate-binding protein